MYSNNNYNAVIFIPISNRPRGPEPSAAKQVRDLCLGAARGLLSPTYNLEKAEEQTVRMGDSFD